MIHGNLEKQREQRENSGVRMPRPVKRDLRGRQILWSRRTEQSVGDYTQDR